MSRFFLVLFAIFSTPLFSQISPLTSVPKLPEISGLILVNKAYWTLNDGGNSPLLYCIDTATGNIVDSTSFVNISNVDWEELTYNDSHIYIGDFGNNNGTRNDLKIYYFPITKLGQQNVAVDTITFYYPLQTSFASDPFTIYDCEAMVATADSIILFSKSFKDALCRVYVLPANRGHYAAKITDTIPLTFWVTGASLKQDKLVLCGYGFGGNLVPAMYETTAIGSGISASGTSTTLPLNLSNQLESIVSQAPWYYILASEASNGYPAQLYRYNIPTNAIANKNKFAFSVHYLPQTKQLEIRYNNTPADRIYLIDAFGKICFESPSTQAGGQVIDTGKFPSGVYFLLVQVLDGTTHSQKIYLE